MPTPQERVQAGAQLLDQLHPDWDEQINLAQLDVSSLSRCVLGQLYGNYYAGLVDLGLIFGNNYGFSESVSLLDTLILGFNRAAKFQKLTEAWRELIAHRRLAKSIKATIHQSELVAV